MEYTEENTLFELINKQLDESEKYLLRFCSIPSFFTQDLIITFLSELCVENIFEDDIERFLSCPFILHRSIGAGNDKIEYFMIHQLAKHAVALSSEEYKLYASVLIKCFDTICVKAPSQLKERYFYEKIYCQLNIGQYDSWRNAYQAAMETNRLMECDKLLEILHSANTEKASDWCTYYDIVNQYINKKPLQELISKAEFLLNTSDLQDPECTHYMQILLGVLYVSVGRWSDSKYLYTHMINEIQSSSLNSYGAIAIACLNLATVCCYISDFDIAKRCIESIQGTIESFSLGYKIASYGIMGLYAKKKCQWERSYMMYQTALMLMETQQQTASLELYQSYKMYCSCPLYCTDDIGIYNRIGEILLLQGNFQEALKYHQKELQSQEIAKNETGLAWSEYNIGKVQYLSGDTKSSREMFFRSISRFQRTDNKNNCAYPLGELSYVFQYDGQPEYSLNCLERSVSILLETGDFEKCIFYFNHLGRICQAQGFLVFAKQIFELCLKYYEKHPSTNDIGWICNNYARNFMYSEDYVDAEVYFQKAFDCFHRNNDKRGLAYIYNNFAELYVKTKQLCEAENLFKKSMAMKIEMGDQHAICYTYRELGELYLRLGDLNQASSNLLHSDQIGRNRGYVMLQGDIALSCGKLLECQGDVQFAMDLFISAEANYKRQNFLSRLINCFKLECNLAKKMNNLQWYTKVNGTMDETIDRKKREELLMTSTISSLMERVKERLYFE